MRIEWRLAILEAQYKKKVCAEQPSFSLFVFDTAVRLSKQPEPEGAQRLEPARIFARDTARRVGNVVHLAWSEADTGNSSILTYTIKRSTSSGNETVLTTVPGTQNSLDDTTASDTTATYYYQVEAANAVGVDTSHITRLGLPDRFVEHGERAELLHDLGLDEAGLTATVLRLVERAKTLKPKAWSRERTA